MRFTKLFLRLGVLLLAVAGGATAAHAQDQPPVGKDVLVFTNGEQLSGKFVREESGSILFSSDMAGQLKIPLAKVKELKVSGEFAVLTNDNVTKHKIVIAGPIHMTQDGVETGSHSGAQETIPDPDIAFIIDDATYKKELAQHPSFLSGWNGSVSGGASLVRATETGETFNLAAGLVRAIPSVTYLAKRNRTSFDVSETYGKMTQPVIPQPPPPAAPVAPSVAKTNIFHADAERDEYFSARFYALADTSFDHNYSSGLNLQQVYGAGIGWTAIQTPKQELDFRVDIHYEKQQFQAPSSNTNLIGSMISENYMRNLPQKIVFTESLSFLPAFNQPSDYSANFLAGLNLPVFKRLSANFNTTDNFLNNPAPGFKKNSFQFVTGISYSLR